MAWLRQLDGTGSKRLPTPGGSWTPLRFDLGSQQVFVFTPKGDVIALPMAGRHRWTSPMRCTPRSVTATSEHV